MLPDISKWDISEATDISYLFSECWSLKNIPNISNWDTKNVTNMEGLFRNCSSLITLPNILQWNINSLHNIQHLFSGCSSLITFPDISKWNVITISKSTESRNSNNILINSKLKENNTSKEDLSLSTNFSDDSITSKENQNKTTYSLLNYNYLIINNNEIDDNYYDNFYCL